MAGRGKKQWARAAICATALVTPLAVGGCASQAGGAGPLGAGKSSTAAGESAGAGTGDGSVPESAASSSGGAKPSDAKASASASSKGGAASGDSIPGLTLSGADDTKILINGKAVDFGMPVYDHTWSPDGKKVAFIDDKSNLWVANADGSGKTEVAKNTTEDKWAHPTWQVAKADPQSGVGAKNNLIFYSTAGNDTLWTVPATAKNGKPQLLSSAPTPRTARCRRRRTGTCGLRRPGSSAARSTSTTTARTSTSTCVTTTCGSRGPGVPARRAARLGDGRRVGDH
ncbi:hypothetical protein ACFQ9X_45280 [Catenulispora yoronensis]